MPLDLINLYRRHVAVSFGKQLHLSELVGTANWHLDLTSGLLSFGDEYRWQVQVLGTTADDSQTWLWAWANEASGIPTRLLVSALTLRMVGKSSGIPELAKPQLPLGKVNGHLLAMIASGIFRADAYYRCPYEGGAAFVLIKDVTFPCHPDPPLARLASVFPQAISAIEIPDHRLTLKGWLDYYGIAGQDEGEAVVVRDGGEVALTAAFDELNRLTKFEVVVGAARRTGAGQ